MQFETAQLAMTTSSLTVPEVHAHYLNSGGSFDELEVDAYLHGLTPLPREERDCIAQAVNELFDDLCRQQGAPYSSGHVRRCSD